MGGTKLVLLSTQVHPKEMASVLCCHEGYSFTPRVCLVDSDPTVDQTFLHALGTLSSKFGSVLVYDTLLHLTF